MQRPKSIEKDETHYKADAWQDYTLQELGAWVHLLCRRANMRSEIEKARKDLEDAQAYLDMMQAMLQEARERIGSCAT